MKYVWITLAALLVFLVAMFYCFGYDLSPVVTDEAFATAALFNERALGMVLVFCLFPLWYLADVARNWALLLRRNAEAVDLHTTTQRKHYNHHQCGEKYTAI